MSARDRTAGRRPADADRWWPTSSAAGGRRRCRRVQYRSVGADSAADWRRANAGAKFAISSVSFLRQNSTQGCLAVPSDISDPPTHAELDEVENNGALLARIFE